MVKLKLLGKKEEEDLVEELLIEDETLDENGIPLSEAKGGWRIDDFGMDFWLTYEQLVDYEKATAEFGSDYKAFDEWFFRYRMKNKIYRTARTSVIGKTWDGDDYDKAKVKSWWSGTVSRDIGAWSKSTGASPEAARMAVLLQAVRTPIRAVDDSTPPMSVNWSTEDKSYTNLEDNTIHINPVMCSDGKLDDDGAIRIATGFGIHEAGHSFLTRSRADALAPEGTYPKPARLAAWLFNVLEDCRLEHLTAERFPGFAFYFEEALEYMWDIAIARGMMFNSKPDTLAEMLNIALVITRWDKHLDALEHVENIEAETAWWTKWRDDYVADKTTPLQAVIDAIEHLKSHVELHEEEEKGGCASGPDGEGKEGEEGSGKCGIAKDIEKMEGEPRRASDEEGDISGTMPTCSHRPTGKGIPSSADIEKARSLADEEFEKWTPGIKSAMRRGIEVYITRPILDAFARDQYIGKPAPIIHRLKAALQFRQELPAFSMRLEREGTIDDEELVRWADGDYRVFKQDIIAHHPQVQMSLLIDMSGSMTGGTYGAGGAYISKLHTAQELGQLLLEAVRTMPTVTVKVFGHTGDTTGSNECSIYRLWEPGDDEKRLGLVSALEHSQNYDGFAIEYCASELLKRGEMNEERVLIVLSDGWPEGTGYHGTAAQSHVRQVVDWAAKNGVRVIQIAIDESMDSVRQGRMFREFIPFEGMDKLPAKLQRLLAKLT